MNHSSGLQAWTSAKKVPQNSWNLMWQGWLPAGLLKLRQRTVLSDWSVEFAHENSSRRLWKTIGLLKPGRAHPRFENKMYEKIGVAVQIAHKKSMWKLWNLISRLKSARQGTEGRICCWTGTNRGHPGICRSLHMKAIACTNCRENLWRRSSGSSGGAVFTNCSSSCPPHGNDSCSKNRVTSGFVYVFPLEAITSRKVWENCHW